MVKTADFYGVSVDYLLGRTTNPNSDRSEPDQIPDVEDLEDVNRKKSNTYCMLNRKIIINSTAVIYSILAEINNKKLSKCVSDYLSVAEYSIFRKIYSLKENNVNDVFSLDNIDDYCYASQSLNNARINDIKMNNSIEGLELNDEILSEKFSDSYPSLRQLIKNAEKTLSQNFKL